MKNYITPDGLNKLLNEQDHLLKKERPEVTKVVTWAASLGDRSENADYQYGKKRLREIDRRLRFLKKRIEAAEVVNPESIKSLKIQFGATVLVSLEEGGDKKYQIVGEDEIRADRGLISWRSPIGTKLLGKEAGDVVEIITPKGKYEMEILEISYQKISL